ncbi:MAG: 2-oxo acid dehydrogenase subunit E2, partial [Rhodospirillaceae bacterium]|nr:2-oxo acid dehydrogenase subunit E2 [Rhodospirillaceae bacterium]
VGDKVLVGEPLVEVETEKITNELESTLEGVLLEILVPEGTTVPVQTPLAVIGQPGAKISAPSAAPAAAAATPVAASAPVAAVSAPALPADGRVKASPIAKRLASEMGINIALVPGTGPEGRIVERDVLAFAEQNKVLATPLAVKVAAELGVTLSSIKKDGRIMKDDVLATLQPAPVAAAAPVATKPVQAAAAVPGGVPISGMRKVISERMSQSWNLAPHVTINVTADMTAATELRKKLAEATGNKVSFTEIITKCAARALTEFKYVNASLINGQIVYHDYVNVGMAVALDDGLIVPVIKDANKKSIAKLGEEIRDLSGKARKGQLGPDNVSGGTFTITNLGMFGVDAFTPIINQPESAILGVCRIVETPVVIKGEIVIRPLMTLCMTCDHRLVDGAVGAKFLARVVQLLEQPLLLV